MVAHYVSFLEEQVLEAEESYGTFRNTICKLFHCAAILPFKTRLVTDHHRKNSLPRSVRQTDKNFDVRVNNHLESLHSNHTDLKKKEKRHPLSAARSCDLPELYPTEDFFPMNYVGTKYQNN